MNFYSFFAKTGIYSTSYGGGFMINVLCKALSFLIVIVVGYYLRHKGIVDKSFRDSITKLALNVTLPAAVVSSFLSFEKNNMLFLLMLMGLVFNVILIGIGYFCSLKKERNMKIMYILSCPGYNIGSFSMPFIQGFLGPQGVVATCMFDTGNALMTCGGTYASCCALIGTEGGEKFGIKDFIRKLLFSVPFDTYVVAFLLAVFNIRLPQAFGNLISTVANANGFMAMLMLGLSLDFNLDKKYYKEVFEMLTVKYASAVILALLIYFVIPFDTMLKQVLTIIVFSPTSALVPAFTQKSGGNTEVAAFAGSVSIVISIIIMVVLITVINP